MPAVLTLSKLPSQAPFPFVLLARVRNGNPAISLHKPAGLLQSVDVKRAIYPGSFDPVTFGHLDVIERAARLFDEVVVAVAFNEAKMALFTIQERLEFLRGTVGDIPNVTIARFDTLLVDFDRERNANAIIRGLRAVSDFEFEFQMALMNRKLDASIETIFLMPKEDFTYLSSRIVKEIARLGGTVDAFVPSSVAKALRERFSPRTEGSHEDTFKTDSR